MVFSMISNNFVNRFPLLLMAKWRWENEQRQIEISNRDKITLSAYATSSFSFSLSFSLRFFFLFLVLYWADDSVCFNQNDIENMSLNILLNRIDDVHGVITRDLETAAVTVETGPHWTNLFSIGPSVCARYSSGSFSCYVIQLRDNQSNHNGKLIYSSFFLFYSALKPIV